MTKFLKEARVSARVHIHDKELLKKNGYNARHAIEYFRRRGLDKVHVEMCLTLIGHLLRKLFAFYDGRAKFDYWIAPPDLSDEMMPEVDAKSFKKTVRKKDINESLRIEHKKKKKVS